MKQARLAAGLSQQALADAIGVSKMAISKYERGRMNPDSTVLIALARALDVPAEHFFRPSRSQLERLSFRKHPSLPRKVEAQVLADARDQLDRWMEVADVVPAAWSDRFERPSSVSIPINNIQDVEEAAERLRDAWNLGDDPIPYLLEVLERHGIKVLASKKAPTGKFDGMTAVADGHRVILVGQDLPGDRLRFTVAHELGHLMLEGQVADDLDEEKVCNRFAGAFLVPRRRALEALGAPRTGIDPGELALLKQKWGLSMLGWVIRASNLGIIKNRAYRELWQMFESKGWDKQEPGDPYPAESTARLQRLILRALAENLMTESKAAVVLGMSAKQLRALRTMARGAGRADR